MLEAEVEGVGSPSMNLACITEVAKLVDDSEARLNLFLMLEAYLESYPMLEVIYFHFLAL